MVPVVSYLVRRGRCGHCGERYGRSYLVVELVTAVAFGLLGLRFGPSPDLAAFLYLAAVGVVLSGIDIARHRLPDVFTKTSYLVLGGLFAIAVPHLPDGPERFIYALIGMAAMALLYFIMWLINPRGMAWGDVKLSGSIGLALGWLGPSAFITGLFVAFLFASAYGLVMIVRRRATMKSAIPFGPFMIGGTLIAVLLSNVVHLYG
jgi:leader peptidase (prepilin peptidase)/N-methyltransferase